MNPSQPRSDQSDSSTVAAEPPVEVVRFGPVGACPACAGERFSLRRDDDDPTFRCSECGSTWRYGLGYLLPAESPRSAQSQ